MESQLLRECMKLIKKLLKKVNILMVTAIGKQELIQKALSLGARGYITKPFKEDQIIEQIKLLD